MTTLTAGRTCRYAAASRLCRAPRARCHVIGHAVDALVVPLSHDLSCRFFLQALSDRRHRFVALQAHGCMARMLLSVETATGMAARNAMAQLLRHPCCRQIRGGAGRVPHSPGFPLQLSEMYCTCDIRMKSRRVLKAATAAGACDCRITAMKWAEASSLRPTPVRNKWRTGGLDSRMPSAWSGWIAPADRHRPTRTMHSCGPRPTRLPKPRRSNGCVAWACRSHPARCRTRAILRHASQANEMHARSRPAISS